MSDENEVQSGEQAGDYHEAVNLWPLAVIGALIVGAFLMIQFVPDNAHREKLIPYGKSYTAVGAIMSCMQRQDGTFRSMIRTTDDTFFTVLFRSLHEPPSAGMAVGSLKYHECGTAEGETVYCFDSFRLTHESVPVLDNNGNRVETKR
jgi:hypothetical protein